MQFAGNVPTVLDQFIQQALLQVLQPLFDPTFSDASYGFRPGRRAHDAVRRAQAYVQEGRSVVVDIDLEKFFDRVNHDRLMAVSVKALRRFKQRIRMVTSRHRGVALQRMIADLYPVLRDWVGYFGFSEGRELDTLNGWIRRRLRGMLWVQWKTRRRRTNSDARAQARNPLSPRS